MSNSKIKIERISPKFRLTTSHHLGEWKFILQFGEREWNSVDARVSIFSPPKFPNPRTLPKTL